ncbi:Cys-tRNA(Pro) deacylase, prolyl-tRNA editing enzyme YbaK/EbsC [Paramicrobacterium humi]|uniref:Cys-tRNA(Pro) deacylase, prolyl-tRNA editing enzyme YbaK/EbsC n=1 Tax=Paramicrobacterium humi TaxID=640635 RepID=A0A1H4QF63_9MICO|nr:YbaK/EbsC family protein [Microbacterium humi]SEC18239.1 Cys-tRNA(Pro) deacylase, prolyl-tRNA editing enzyme YbaK/EbsC [Microbacterium humi]
MSTGIERFRADAADRGIRVEIVSRGRARSLEEAAELLGITPARIVKTLVVKRHDGSFVFALIPGGRKISWAKLRRLLAVNKLSLPDADTAKAVTGYERGTITVLGSETALPVVADATISGSVAIGAGDHEHSARVDAAPYLSAVDATIADISDPE